MKCKEIQEKDKIVLQLQNKKKVEKLKEKGITLIALVVTIIILLILAGVTLNMAMSGNGLFSRARTAADKYKKAQEDEADLISEIGKEMNSEYVGAFVTGYEPTGKEYTITGDQSGTGTDQNFITVGEKNGEELKWRIWDYDGTTLRIILDRPTIQKLELKGVAGYNNGVWAMNEVCRECFGQYDGKEMKNGISVSNLKRSDIQKVCNYDYTEYSSTSNAFGTIMFGGTTANVKNTNYPIMWELNDQLWSYENKDGKVSGDDKECLIWEDEGENRTLNNQTGNENLTFKQSYYYHDYKNEVYRFKDQKYYEMIFGNVGKESGIYWLGGRFVNFTNEGIQFGLNNVGVTTTNCGVGGKKVIEGNGEEVEGVSLRLRPIVSLDMLKCGLTIERDEEDLSSYIIKELKI